ncbi:MAG: deoxyribonuclease HsdR [Bacteroidetes bacterium]|nr:MAG: deoxyribonuclease HsdR [Bacteroidota bacterium]RLD73396.1 MAG: deoxyribonuclease HsdR [Bacteroidota bacterium]
MKTVGKSFIGAAAGTIFILLIAAVILNSTFKENDKQTKQTDQISNMQQLPVHRANYLIAQEADFVRAAEKSVNAVVHIKTEISVKSSTYDDFFGPFKYYFGQPNRMNTYVAFGSGVIISPDGYIVTNNHVVEGADKVSVTFNDRREMEATIVGMDPATDLALIKVDADDLVYLSFGNSDEVKVGEWVLAVGNPFNLTSTVTAGIVSAKARNINILGSQSAIESFIQTDAAVNRGNSGGALVNTDGELIGINAAIASHTGVYEGYSFAIPVNIVHKVVDDLMKYGEIQRAFIGVQIRDIDASFADKLGLEEVKGIYVAGVVEDGGAYDAGIREGDVILSVNEQETNTVSELMGAIGQHNPGEIVTIEINRDREKLYYDVTLRNQEGTTGIIKAEDSFYNELLGASMKKITGEEKNKLGIGEGLKVTEVGKGFLDRGGITKGFIITEINGHEISSKESLEKALSNNKSKIIRLKGMYLNGVRISYEFML